MRGGTSRGPFFDVANLPADVALRDRVLPERAQVGMTQPFLKAYSELLIRTYHRRGAHAMGGMAAQIPISGDAGANDAALARVRADKLREVTAGHDGTWVAHPALIPLAREEGLRGGGEQRLLAWQGAGQVHGARLGAVLQHGRHRQLQRLDQWGTEPSACVWYLTKQFYQCVLFEFQIV